MLHVFDANSWVRRFLEVDTSGMPIRNLIWDANNSPDVHIFVWDGKGGNDRRRALFPNYTAGRKPAAENIFASMNLARDALKHSRALQICVPGYEGDDVIAALVGRWAGQTEIKILSTDRDLYALCAVEGVTHPTVTNPKCPAVETRLYKATRGDPSDAIPGIKGFGEKAWEACDKEAFQHWYENDWSNISHWTAENVAERFGIPKACASWLRENEELARTFWAIVGFFPPTAEEIEAHTTVGKRDDAAVDALLGRFLQ